MLSMHRDAYPRRAFLFSLLFVGFQSSAAFAKVTFSKLWSSVASASDSTDCPPLARTGCLIINDGVRFHFALCHFAEQSRSELQLMSTFSQTSGSLARVSLANLLSSSMDSSLTICRTLPANGYRQDGRVCTASPSNAISEVSVETTTR